MEMIIGGAFQGKTEYVKYTYLLTEGDIADGAILKADELCQKPCIKNFHLYIKHLLENSIEPLEAVTKFIKQNPEIIIITNEIGYGIVPLVKADREWREVVGRVCTLLAKEAKRVTRITCGIPNIIKGGEQ